MTHAAGDATLQLTANTDWSVAPSSVPEWLTLEPAAGNGSREVKLTLKPNEETQERRATVAFIAGGVKRELTVAQSGQEPREMCYSNLAFSMSDVKEYAATDGGAERVYDFSTIQMFINPESKLGKNIFLGSLINLKAESNTDITEYKGYTYHPITVCSPSPVRVKSKTFYPSRAEQDAYARQIMDVMPTQNVQFLSKSGERFDSHRELHLIGMGNMGVALDEVFSGLSYREQEMTLRHGVIYSFSQTAFRIIMDFPENGNILKETIDKDAFPAGSLGYVDGIAYGRMGLLIVESNHSLDVVKPIVGKIIRKGRMGELTAEERVVLGELEACHVYFDKSGKMVVNRGKEDAIRAYVEQATMGVDDVYPYSFTVCDYFDFSMAYMNFRLRLP